MPSLLSHLGHVLQLAVILLGPVPLCLRVTATGEEELEERRGMPSYLAALVTWSSAQIALGLVLALAGLFQAPACLAGELLLMLAGWILLRRRSPTAAILSPYKVGRALDTREAALVLALSIVAWSAAWELMREPTTNFDSLAYHLPVMARWVQTQRLAVVRELGQVTFYPAHWELLGAMLVVPLGHDLLVSLPNLLAWLQLGLAMVAVGRELGPSPVASLAAAGLVLTVPALVGGLDAIQPDLALTAFLLSAIYFALRWLRHARPVDLGLLLLCLGMLAGLKMSGPVYAAPLVLLTIAVEVRRRWRGRPTAFAASREARGPLAGALAVAALLGLAWYGRNLVVEGNPAGLLQVSWGGRILFPGSLTRQDLAETTLAAIFQPGRGDHWRILFEVARGWLGIAFALLVVFAVTGVVLAMARRADRLKTAVLLVVFAVAVALYANTPFSGDNGEHAYQLTPWIHVGLRYGFPAIAALGLLAAIGMRASRLPEGAWVALVVGTSVLAVVTRLTPTAWALWIGSVVAFFGVLALHRRPRWTPASWKIQSAGGILLFALLVGVTYLAAGMRDHERVRQYGPVYTYLEEHLAPGAKLGYVNTPKLYPLLGRSWRRRLIEVTPDTLDEHAWVDRLRADRIAALVVGHSPPTGRDRRAQERAQHWVREDDLGLVLLQDYESQLFDVAVYGFAR